MRAVGKRRVARVDERFQRTRQPIHILFALPLRTLFPERKRERRIFREPVFQIAVHADRDERDFACVEQIAEAQTVSERGTPVEECGLPVEQIEYGAGRFRLRKIDGDGARLIARRRGHGNREFFNHLSNIISHRIQKVNRLFKKSLPHDKKLLHFVDNSHRHNYNVQ